MSSVEKLKSDIEMFRAKGASWKWFEKRVRELKPALLPEFYRLKQEYIQKEMVHG